MKAIDLSEHMDSIRQVNCSIPDEMVDSICKKGCPDVCRYLCWVDGGHKCMKHTSVKKVVDNAISESALEHMSDNCEGLK